MSRQAKSPFWGGICILSGVYILLVSLGALATVGVESDTPKWVLWACSITFVAAGIALSTEPRSLARSVCVACILIAMASVGVWVSVFSPADGFSGGIPFLPRSLNVGLARGLFGFGALICLLMLLALWRTVAKKHGD